MAADESWQRKQGKMATIDSSSILEMEVVNDNEDSESDYEVNINGDQQPTKEEAGSLDSMKAQFSQNVGSFVWQTGAQQAKKAFTMYGNIDILRPYFDVEPHEVRSRLLYSLVPTLFTTKKLKAHRELYGPTMLVFTLIAVLLYQMKSSDHHVQEGTLMGSAFAVCFGYWLGSSSFVWFVAYVCNARIVFLQILSLLGYALFSHCLVLFLGTVLHTSHDHMLFFLLWAIFGGLSSLKMMSVLTSRTNGAAQKMIVSASVVGLHMCFLLYLHFAYHQIVEELSDLAVAPNPVSKLGDSDTGERPHNIVERSVEQITVALVETIDNLSGGVQKIPRDLSVNASS